MRQCSVVSSDLTTDDCAPIRLNIMPLIEKYDIDDEFIRTLGGEWVIFE